MPYSSESGKAYIRNIVGRVKHDRMLDIGCGSGTYAKMFPDADWTGVEVWEPYVEQFGLNDLYSNLILSDARSVDFESLGRFDVAILGDVLEHMEKDEAKALFERVRSISDTVIVSIPIGHYPQEAWNGNPHEEHVTNNWSDEEFRKTFFEPTVGYIDNEIGVYCWSDQKIRPKICIYAISKNEEQFVQRWADSGRDADLLLVADTGSTDGTVEACRKAGVSVHEICITPWRFDHARNASIALIPRDIDICISLDLDEVMEPGWREEIERVWTPQTTRLRYMFDWGCGIKFAYEKIHARHGYFWHHPCHEYPVFDKRINEVYAYTDKLLVSHHPDPTKSRGQYLDLLDLSVKEDPACPRNAFYYARELSFHGRWDDSIVALNRYLTMPGADWPNERAYAMRTMARCYEGKGDMFAAETWLMRAAAETPNTREPWCGLATLYYMQGRWQECYSAALRALSVKNRDLVYTVDPEVWGYQPHDYAAIAAWNLGLRSEALEHARNALCFAPEDPRLINNLKMIEEAVLRGGKKIPNIIHFIWLTGPKSRDFTFVNYLAIKVARDVQRPDKVFLYYNEDLPENPHWQSVKSLVQMVKIEAPKDVDGVSLEDWPQYQSDIVRLEKLYEHGGIYLDTDCFMLKPFDDLMDSDCVMSGFVDGMSEGAIWGENEYASGAVILAAPKSKFIGLWRDGVAEGLKTGVWAWHCVNLPIQVYRKHPDLITLLPHDRFLPFDFHNKSVIDPEKKNDVLRGIGDSYTIHLWDTIWNEQLKSIDFEFMKKGESAFAELFGKHV